VLFLNMPDRIIRYCGAVLCVILFSIPSLHAQDALNESYIETFDDSDFRDRWWFSNYESGGAHKATAWRRRMASVEIPVVDAAGLTGALTLRLAPSGESSDRPFLGAEVQRGGGHLYGDYEVIMQAGKGPGVVTAFFTYTGPHFGDPHDEVDFEILGKDTTSAWINRFVDGERMPGMTLPLGFDAAAAPHLYKMAWRTDSITWSVDGQDIHQITDADMPIPSHAGKLFLSLWAGHEKQIGWLGEADPDTRTTARFYCVSYIPVGGAGKSCADHPVPPS
jgi:endo-1,3-1,4-beta-glycanase ExoK